MNAPPSEDRTARLRYAGATMAAIPVITPAQPPDPVFAAIEALRALALARSVPLAAARSKNFIVDGLAVAVAVHIEVGGTRVAVRVVLAVAVADGVFVGVIVGVAVAVGTVRVAVLVGVATAPNRGQKPPRKARLSICCWAAEPMISGATIGRKPRTVRWRTA